MVHEALRPPKNSTRTATKSRSSTSARSNHSTPTPSSASVARTGRLLAVGEAFPWGGVTAEVVSRVVTDGFHLLDAPPQRLNSADTPIPYHPDLWTTHRPTAQSIASTLRDLISF